ncbi:MmcB family DNA repair protein [Enterovibrio norvegicus]|uniref:MmcB family DNA repair protein n=1 Tax=Enterovibrio norvegicus TaxID=188144 RepID=UPI000CBE8EED|nr:MmcB family DNA repair protein [Enterovibrio norvegicus]PMH68377.1 hypothetical protein BCU62_00695 [Enterovibrio norvegicus]
MISEEIKKIKERFSEKEIKAELINFLIGQGKLGPHDILINEFTIDKHARRADLVVLKSNEIHAYEIKSDFDNLLRLKGQADKYINYFDKTFVVTTLKHFEKVEDLLPKSIGLIVFDRGTFTFKKRGRKKLVSKRDIFISMMTANDLKKLLASNKIPVKSLRRYDMEVLVEGLNSGLVRDYTLKSIGEKYRVSSKRFFDKIDEKDAGPNDIEILSPYRKAEVKYNSVSEIEMLVEGLDLI